MNQRKVVVVNHSIMRIGSDKNKYWNILEANGVLKAGIADVEGLEAVRQSYILSESGMD